MNIAVLGSTGSIGCNALRVINNLSGNYKVFAVSARSNIALLSRQIAAHKPRMVWVEDFLTAQKLKLYLDGAQSKVTISFGVKNLSALASHRTVDMVLVALVGAAGLEPLLSAIKSRKKIALANKESLVIAGDIVMREAVKNNVSIIPVDSEHSAIFQCIQNARKGEIKRIILTASGGPLYKKKNSFKTVRVKDALSHPNWKMGKKITIDSATLMNKGLEAIEAHHLFGMPMDRIEILIHPQSIVHSLVEFIDGTLLAQLSNPDMRGPIQYALTYPFRHNGIIRTLKLEEIKKLEFYKPDFKRFPCLGLALKAGSIGGSMPAVLNAANEIAVQAFLDGKIGFNEIASIVRIMMRKHTLQKYPDLSHILTIDRHTRTQAQKLVDAIKK